MSENSSLDAGKGSVGSAFKRTAIEAPQFSDIVLTLAQPRVPSEELPNKLEALLIRKALLEKNSQRVARWAEQLKVWRTRHKELNRAHLMPRA